MSINEDFETAGMLADMARNDAYSQGKDPNKAGSDAYKSYLKSKKYSPVVRHFSGQELSDVEKALLSRDINHELISRRIEVLKNREYFSETQELENITKRLYKQNGLNESWEK